MFFFPKSQTTFTDLTHSYPIVVTQFLNSLNNVSDKDYSELTLDVKGQETEDKPGLGKRIKLVF